MSTRTLQRIRTICGNTAVAAFLVLLAAPVLGLGETTMVLAVAAALLGLAGWAECREWIEIRRIVEDARPPHRGQPPDAYRDLDA